MIGYRSDIDGLRAIAVLAVIAYHFKLSFPLLGYATGGYIGVDVFFVISGYVITQLLKQPFRLADFYERRVRRILPALLTVMFACFPLAFVFMLPKAAGEYGRSVLAALFSVSNIYFLREDSYTAEPSLLKPFLHSWSLGVEEQFYLLFPLLMLFLKRYFPRYIGRCLLLLFAASLLLAHGISLEHRDAAFYLLPTRAWELLAGALLAMHGGHRPHRQFRWIMWPALLAMAASFFLFDSSTQHPSLLTVIPVGATMLLIYGLRPSDRLAGLLACRPMTFIGRRSYSLYLWHFPVLAFARIIAPAEAERYALGLLALTALLSALSYRYVEQPFRDRQRVSCQRLTLSVLVAVLMVAAGHLYLIAQQGGANSSRRFDISRRAQLSGGAATRRLLPVPFPKDRR